MYKALDQPKPLLCDVIDLSTNVCLLVIVTQLCHVHTEIFQTIMSKYGIFLHLFYKYYLQFDAILVASQFFGNFQRTCTIFSFQNYVFNDEPPDNIDHTRDHTIVRTFPRVEYCGGFPVARNN